MELNNEAKEIVKELEEIFSLHNGEFLEELLEYRDEMFFLLKEMSNFKCIDKVCVLSEKEMQKYDDNVKSLKEYDDYRNLPDYLKEDNQPKYKATETLGFYAYENETKTALIVLCPDRIKRIADELEVNFNDFMRFIFYHELGHAYMCPFLNRNKERKFQRNAVYQVVEESFANLFALKKIQEENNKYLDKFKKFVKTQPSEYAFALTFLDNSFDKIRFGMVGWRELKTKAIGKSDFTDAFLNKKLDLKSLTKGVLNDK